MIRSYFKIAIRHLFRHKVYSLINIGGLSVGLACSILILLWVQFEMGYDKFHENADRLYRVAFAVDQKAFHGYFQPGPLAAELKEIFPEIVQSTNFSEVKLKLSYQQQGFICGGSLVDPAFFEMFTFPLERGNSKTVLADPHSAVISKALAQKMFGTGDPIGKTLRLEDIVDLVVTGVFKDVPAQSHMQFDFVMSFEMAPPFMKVWDSKCTNTYVLLRKDCSLDEINTKIHGLMNTHNPTWNNVLYLFPMTGSHLYTLEGGGPIIYIYIFSALSLLILLVACINFINLSTARSEKRMMEIGIKKAVGCSRFELAKQFLIETIVVALLSLIVALLWVELLVPVINHSLDIQVDMHYSARMLALLCSLALLTGLIAGIYPALYLSSFQPMLMLRGKPQSSTGRRSFFPRKVLVIAQLSFSIFIITCTVFIYYQLHFIQSRNLGFNKDQLLMVKTRGKIQAACPTIKNELLRYPSIQSVTVSGNDLTRYEIDGPAEWEGKNINNMLEFGYNSVDEDFLKTFQMKMTQGRFFSREVPTDMAEAFVINEAAVKAMDLVDPVGKRLTTFFGRKGKIIGVIADFNTQSLRTEMTPIILLPTPAAGYLCVRLKAEDMSGSIKTIESTLKKIVPDDPFEYQFLDKKIEQLYKAEQITGKLAIFIATLAMFISCLGLLGLISFSTERRTKEIGIRKVTGASVFDILIILTRDFTKWALLANLIAWPLAYYAMHHWLQNFAYRIHMSWWVFALSGALALLLSLLTVSFQAFKAATANPVVSLRYE